MEGSLQHRAVNPPSAAGCPHRPVSRGDPLQAFGFSKVPTTSPPSPGWVTNATKEATTKATEEPTTPPLILHLGTLQKLDAPSLVHCLSNNLVPSPKDPRSAHPPLAGPPKPQRNPLFHPDPGTLQQVYAPSLVHCLSSNLTSIIFRVIF